MPAACYPVYPAIAARGPLPRRRRVRRCRRRLGVPPRALARPGPPADVPPARDGADRRARGGAGVARRVGASAGWSCCARSASPPSSTSPPTRSSAAAGGCSPPTSASRSSSSSCWCRSRAPSRPRSPRSTTTRITSPRPTGSSSADGGDRPHGLPGLRPGADRAGAAAHARPRPGRVAGRGAGGAVGAMSAPRTRRPAAACSGCDPARYAAARAARRGRAPTSRPTATRTSSSSCCTRAATSRSRRSATSCGCDFEGDQWTFFKPPPEDLETLFGIDIHEMQPYRPLPDADRRADRRAAARSSSSSTRGTCPTPPRPATAREHVKSSVVAEAIDLDARASALLPQRRPATSSTATTTAACSGSAAFSRRRAAAVHRARPLRCRPAA